MFSHAVHIFASVVLPVLVIVGLGAVLQRKFPLHIRTMTRLNVYLFVPAFLFDKVYHSNLDWSAIGSIALGVLTPMIAVGLVLLAVLKLLRVKGEIVAVMLVTCLVFNAGNFGIPVAELLYEHQAKPLLFPGMGVSADGIATQALVVMFANLSVWGVGYMVMSLAKGDGLRKGALGYFKLPMIYVVVTALLLRDIHPDGRIMLPRAMTYPISTIAAAAVPVMLITLAAQLMQRARWPDWRVVGPVVAIKLLVLPAATALVTWSLGMWPWPGAQLVIASAAPTAVNALLLTLELDGDSNLAADCVFWTTVLSAATVTIAITLVTVFGGAM